MDAGKLVPDEITIGMAKDRMLQPDAAQGFLLDGFPRNLGQAKALDEILGDAGMGLDGVLDLEVPEDEVVKRIAGRRLCRNNGSHVFHVVYHPPTAEGLCDECGGELYQRSDDTEDAVRVRLEEYRSKTEPIVGYYSDQKLLMTILALGAVEEITERAVAALRSRSGGEAA
jgi:adenylate kinase